jgi:hypothetical protein
MWSLFFLAGCVPKSSYDGVDTASTNNSTNNGTQGPIDTPPAESVCEDLDGTAHPGASTYFAGSYSVNGETLTGLEEAIYVANSSWEPILGASDCRVTWALTGTVVASSACTTCDLHIQVSAMLDESQSDCPSELAADWQSSWTETYGVARNDDGSADWYFGSSGEYFASGNHSGSNIDFLSDVQCSWF